MLQDSWFVDCADYIFLDWFARCYLQMNVWLKLTMDDSVCFRCLEKVILWSRLCFAKDELDTIVSMFIWFCYLGWIMCGSNLKWCDLRTSKINQVEGAVLIPVLIFFNKVNTYRLEKMIIRTTCKAVNFFSNVARVKYSLVTSRLRLHLHLLLLLW